MVPTKTHPKWAALLEGRLTCDFNHAAASMLLFRLQSDLKNDASPAGVAKATDELHALFTKYEPQLETELKAIFG